MEEQEHTNRILTSLASLPPLHLSQLTQTLLNITHRHTTRLSAILSSPTLYAVALQRLLTLSFPTKTALVCRHLAALLLPIAQYLQLGVNQSASSNNISSRDLDAVLLLLFLCETHRTEPELLEAPLDRWRQILKDVYSDALLESVSGIWAHNSGVLIPYTENVIRCRRFILAMPNTAGKGVRETAACPKAVVALPEVERVVGGGECVVCREEMKEGRRVCEMPCKHQFHWMCILPWLGKRNTCPCCRHQLPTDDVFAEVERLWNIAVRGGDGAAWRNPVDG